MPLSTATGYSDYKHLVEVGQFQEFFVKLTSGVASASAGNSFSMGWTQNLSAGTAPTSAVSTTVESTTPGSLLQSTVALQASTALYIAEIEAEHCPPFGNFEVAIDACWMIVDRLSHSNGCNWDVSTSQAVGLPTPLPTRSSGGIGNMMALVTWTSAANAATNVTVKYANENGTSGQTAPLVAIPATAPGNRAYIIPTAAGDKGVRWVDDVTVATTAAAVGNFGFIVFRPLALLPTMAYGPPSQGVYRNMLVGGGGAMSSVHSSACLDLWCTHSNAGGHNIMGRINMIESS